MQAIITKYHGPTNTRGSRISARCEAGRVSIPYPHELSGQAVHRAAAEALAANLGWTGAHYGELLGGGLPSGEYVFVFDNDGAKQ